MVSIPIADAADFGHALVKNLKQLFLAAKQVNDISPLAELKNLRTLDLNGTHVSEEQVQELRQALPNCKIWTD